MTDEADNKTPEEQPTPKWLLERLQHLFPMTGEERLRKVVAEAEEYSPEDVVVSFPRPESEEPPDGRGPPGDEPPDKPPGGRPPGEGDGGGGGAIRVVAGRQHEAVDAAEAALLAAGPGPVFQRGGMLVHIAERPARRSGGAVEQQEAIAPLEQAAFREVLGRIVAFEKFDGRLKSWRAIDPPRAVAEAYYGRPRWDLPDLAGVIGTPTLRADSSLLAAPGWDGQTGIYLVRALDGLKVPDKPSLRQASAANDSLVELLHDFPWADEDSEAGLSLAVALAGLLGAMLRPTLPAVPLIGVTAPARGTGKSYLVNLVSIIATGRAAVTVATGSTPEELEKALGAELMAGRQLLSLDNMTQALGGQLLCMAISQERVAVRVLGQSKSVEIPPGAALFATGNNLRVSGDMARRALLCRLDARLERPEERSFETDLLAEATRRRAELVSAALTIARWGALRRDPAPLDGSPFAGFEAWCRRVRDPLLALGHLDAVRALKLARQADLAEANFVSLVEAWATAWPSEALTVREVLRRIANGAAAEVAGAFAELFGRNADNAAVIGKYLAQREGRIVAGRRFVRTVQGARQTQWRLVTEDQ